MDAGRKEPVTNLQECDVAERFLDRADEDFFTDAEEDTKQALPKTWHRRRCLRFTGRPDKVVITNCSAPGFFKVAQRGLPLLCPSLSAGSNGRPKGHDRGSSRGESQSIRAGVGIQGLDVVSR